MKRKRNPDPHLRLVEGPVDSDVGQAPSDEDLIAAIEQGDGRTAGFLYDRLFPAVDRTLVRVMGRREHDHDDLVQASFEQIIITICSKRYARACSLDAWAATLASRIAFNALRSRVRERRVVDRQTDTTVAVERKPSGRDVEREVSVRQQLERMRRNLSEMRESRATTLFLHDGLGYDLAEIATLTRVSVSAAQSRLVRARRELRQRMGVDETKREDER